MGSMIKMIETKKMGKQKAADSGQTEKDKGIEMKVSFFTQVHTHAHIHTCFV